MNPVDKKAWLSVPELLALSIKRFIIAGLFSEGSFNLIVAPRKVGKTLLMLDCAAHRSGVN